MLSGGAEHIDDFCSGEGGTCSLFVLSDGPLSFDWLFGSGAASLGGGSRLFSSAIVCWGAVVVGAAAVYKIPGRLSALC